MTPVLACSGIGRGGDGETSVMTGGGRQLGDDAYYLEVTARLFGWRVVWEQGGRAMRMARGPWRLRLSFGPRGSFQAGVLHGAGRGRWELDLPEVVALLERGAKRWAADYTKAPRPGAAP